MYYCIFIQQISYYHVCASTFSTLWEMLLTMPALPLCGTILYLPSYSPYMSSLHIIHAFASLRSTHLFTKILNYLQYLPFEENSQIFASFFAHFLLNNRKPQINQRYHSFQFFSSAKINFQKIIKC